MKILGYTFLCTGATWILAAMLVIWLPIIVHLWLPESWIPTAFPSNPLEIFPDWLMWLPFPGVNPTLFALSLTNLVLAAPGFVLLFGGAKIANVQI